jgi:ABC-2 type transport system ATP-binding protein
MVSDENTKVVLKVENVEKSFRLPTEQASGLKQLLINWTKGIKGYREQQVLKGISFEVHQGDFFGIVGRNGSGKSTLLKLISQIYVPERGSIAVDGKLVPFIELGVGFNPELTGRENVYLNGALLGFSRSEIDEMYDDIVEFAELEDFMDQKLKNYSSGMQVRLAFSVAIQARGDILVLDEVLAVGDEAFQRKCDTFFASVKKDPSKTVILVTHSMDAVKKYCNKAILIKDGRVIASGDKNDVADRYTLENLKAESHGQAQDGVFETGLSAIVPTLKINPISPVVTDGTSPFVFDIEYDYRDEKDFYLSFSMFDVKRGGIPFDSTPLKMDETGHHRMRFSLALDMFNSGQYKLFATLRNDTPGSDTGETDMIAFTSDRNCCFFVIRSNRANDYALLADGAVGLDMIGMDCE